MGYPGHFEETLRRVRETRSRRMNEAFPRLTPSEKTELLQKYHPDYREGSNRALRVGPNRGEPVPNELAGVLESFGRVDPDRYDPNRVDLETDVLVIGGGGGGSTAALFAHANGARVLLTTKLRLGDANTIMAEGGIGAATEPTDSPAIHYIDTMGGGGYKNVPELVRSLVLDAPLIVEWLESLGVMFDRRPDGSILTHAPGGHSRRRSHSCRDMTGLEIMRVLREEIRNRGIAVREFAPAVELLRDERGGCGGAVLYDLDTDRFLNVKAKSVILATGGLGRLHINQFPTSNHYGATADGLVLGYRLGVRLIYADAVQYHPTGVAWPEQMLGQLITEALRSHGAQLINYDGEPFINLLETRDAVASAIIRECSVRGKGVRTPTGMDGTWLDTPMIDLIGGQGKMARQFTGIYKRFSEYGIDVSQDPILIYPTQHYQNGGLVMDQNARTGVEGLYAVGEVGGGVHGRNRLGSNSLVDIFVFGRRAGLHAAANCLGRSPGRLNLDHVKTYHEELRLAGADPARKSPMLLPDYLRPETLARKYF